MNRSRPLTLGALLLTAALCTFMLSVAVMPAVAAQPEIQVLTPKPGELLRPGDIVTISWNLLAITGATPGPTGEYYIFLSTDNGKSFPIQVAGPLSGKSTSYDWKVNGLETKTAQIQVLFKFPEDGGNHPEGTSGTFSILSAPATSKPTPAPVRK